jgi:coenzyme PQQ precursor peptide PqqA
LAKTRGRRNHMREWLKPTIEETESGMEVTSYLPAELDRA